MGICATNIPLQWHNGWSFQNHLRQLSVKFLPYEIHEKTETTNGKGTWKDQSVDKITHVPKAEKTS